MRTYFAQVRIGEAMRRSGKKRPAARSGPPMNPRVAALLREVLRSGSLRKASRTLGIAAGNAHRVLRNEEGRLGVRLLAGSRGGRNGGGSRLTSAGRTLARRHSGLVSAGTTWWPCRLLEAPRRDRPLRVFVPDAGVSAFVAPIGRPRNRTGRQRLGTELELGIVPETVTILPRGARIAASAQNVWLARVIKVRKPTEYGVQFVDVEVGLKPLVVAVTASAVSQLRLRSRSKVALQLKATALRLRQPIA